jgi:hypothetical protein
MTAVTVRPATPGPSTTLIRATLWISAPMNLAVATLLAIPGSGPARLLGLRGPVDPVYAALSSWMVALFGLAYAWMARQAVFDRPLLCLGAVGKAGAFVGVAVLWLSDAASGTLVLAASADLALAALWLRWLAANRVRADAAPVSAA